MSEKRSVLSRRQILGFGAVAPLSGYALHKDVVVKSASQKRPAWKQEVLYHGPMRLPPRVLDVALSGRLVKSRSRHMCVRVNDGGVAYLFRVLGVSEYLGEIVRSERGQIRIHVWSLIDCADARSSDDLLARYVDGVDVYAKQNAERDSLDAIQEDMA